MTYSYVSHLYCPKCGNNYSTKRINQLCECGSPLLVAYRMDELKEAFKPKDLEKRAVDLWRYHELLPVEDPQNVVSLGEGLTPMLSMNKTGKQIGIPHLFMKDEGLIPSGTYKSRGATVGVSKAKEVGARGVAMATNGNAGAAWSLYCTKADIPSTIVMPIDAPEITQKQCAVAGADLYLVNGLVGDAAKVVSQSVRDYNLLDASTLKEPYRIEGDKVMGYEIAEQFEWKVPDVILWPTGGGVGLIAIYKALQELKELGWIPEGKMPRLVAVQSEGCAPIIKAWEEGKSSADPWEDASTIAFGINVGQSHGDFLILDAIKQTNGTAISVSDDVILEELRFVANTEGVFICPEGAAAFAAARKLREQNWIQREDRVVILNTGTGIKYPNTIEVDAPILQKGESI